jgi:hypothetical protein
MNPRALRQEGCRHGCVLTERPLSELLFFLSFSLSIVLRRRRTGTRPVSGDMGRCWHLENFLMRTRRKVFVLGFAITPQGWEARA